MEESELYKQDLWREITGRICGQLMIDSAQQSDRYRIALYSAINGRWEDVRRDISRERITPQEATRIIDSMLDAHLITVFQACYQKEQIKTSTRTH